MSTNVNDYTIEDLLAILNIQVDSPTQFQVQDSANNLISQLKIENKEDLATFIEDAKEKIIDELFNEEDFEDEDEDNIQNDETTQQGNLWKNQYPEQKNNNIDSAKPTNRNQKVDIFDKEGKQNNAFVMSRERLGVLQAHPIPVVQGTINPNLKNTIRRIVSIDSQYRANIIPYSNNNPSLPSFNTDFSFDLSEKLNNVISMKLNSIHIPTTWYAFDESLGNTCFLYYDTQVIKYINIPAGNYTIASLNAYFVDQSLDIFITIETNTGKIVFNTTSKVDIEITFYHSVNFNNYRDKSCSTPLKINQNFGWSLGFRNSAENNLSINITDDVPRIAEAQPNFYGPSYFLLVVDDYNNNRVNNTLITNTSVSNKLDLPSYYNSSKKTDDCPDISGLPYAIPYAIKTSPRQLTQSQLYTANEILYNRTTSSNKTNGVSSADVLAVIPLNGTTKLRTNLVYNTQKPAVPDTQSSQFSQPYILYGQQLEGNDRTYFGPVNIDHMRVRLLDDKGNLVNLNDVDWSFSLLVEQLYQY